MIRKVTFLIALFAVLFQISLSYAGSFYARHGIGLLRYRDGVKATSMGGLSLAMADSVSIFFLNPATMARVNTTHIQGEFLYDRASISLPNTEAKLQESNVNGLGILIPFKRGFAFAFGLQPYSISDYEFQGEGETDNERYRETFLGSGGVDNVYIALAGTFGRFRVGLAGDFYFGLMKRNWMVDYESADLIDTNDQFETDLRGFGFHGGIHTQTGNWELGAAISTPVNVDAASDLRAIALIDTTIESFSNTIRLPIWYGFGAGYHPSRKFVIGAQARFQQWGSVEPSELFGAKGVNNHILGIGLEFTPSADQLDGFFEKLNYRVGFSQSRLPYENIAGESISEYLVSGGIGVPFNRGHSRIDFAVEFGKRGSTSNNLADEAVFRFSASVSGSERWFQRRRRR